MSVSTSLSREVLISPVRRQELMRGRVQTQATTACARGGHVKPAPGEADSWGTSESKGTLTLILRRWVCDSAHCWLGKRSFDAFCFSARLVSRFRSSGESRPRPSCALPGTPHVGRVSCKVAGFVSRTMGRFDGTLGRTPAVTTFCSNSPAPLRPRAPPSARGG